MKTFILLFCVFLLRSILCSLAPFIKPCHAPDAACLKDSAQRALPVLAAGVPSLGLEPLDPLSIKTMKSNQAGLTLEFKNTNIRGLKNCLIMDLKRTEHSTFVKTKCSVILAGDYSLRGQLLMLPIEGDGQYKIVIHNIIVNVNLDVGKKAVDGKHFWTIENWLHTFENPTGVRYIFKNLFNGDKKLWMMDTAPILRAQVWAHRTGTPPPTGADPVQKFTNENWLEVFREVAPPVVKEIVARVVEGTTKLFDKVPINQLELD